MLLTSHPFPCLILTARWSHFLLKIPLLVFLTGGAINAQTIIPGGTHDSSYYIEDSGQYFVNSDTTFSQGLSLDVGVNNTTVTFQGGTIRGTGFHSNAWSSNNTWIVTGAGTTLTAYVDPGNGATGYVWVGNGGGATGNQLIVSNGARVNIQGDYTNSLYLGGQTSSFYGVSTTENSVLVTGSGSSLFARELVVHNNARGDTVTVESGGIAAFDDILIANGDVCKLRFDDGYLALKGDVSARLQGFVSNGFVQYNDGVWRTTTDSSSFVFTYVEPSASETWANGIDLGGYTIMHLATTSALVLAAIPEPAVVALVLGCIVIPGWWFSRRCRRGV